MSNVMGLKHAGWVSGGIASTCLPRAAPICPRPLRANRPLCPLTAAISTDEQQTAGPPNPSRMAGRSATIVTDARNPDPSTARAQLETTYATTGSKEENAAGAEPNELAAKPKSLPPRIQPGEARPARYQQNDGRYQQRPAQQRQGQQGYSAGSARGWSNEERQRAAGAGQGGYRNDQRRYNNNQSTGGYNTNNPRQQFPANGQRQQNNRRASDDESDIGNVNNRNVTQDAKKVLKPLVPGLLSSNGTTVAESAPASGSNTPSSEGIVANNPSAAAPSTPVVQLSPGPTLLQKPALMQKPTLKKPELPVGLVRPQMPPRPQGQGQRPARRVDPRNIRIVPEQQGAGRPGQDQQRQQPYRQGQQQQGQQQQGQPQAPGTLKVVVVEDDATDTAADKKGGRAKPQQPQQRKGRRVITAAMKRAGRIMRKEQREANKVTRDKEEVFEVGEEGMSVADLAEMLQINDADIITNLFMKGIVCTANQTLDKNTVKLVAKEFDVMVLEKEEISVADAAKKNLNSLDEEDLENLTFRPPVVTVMGHVDHGKTSLLDYIRKSTVAAGEAGGITQQIGAYTTQVEVEGDAKTICFLDTPGHEAFSAMRARGARVTDVCIIIVAADDGVQPQTREAISHAQAAEVPIIVAINKVDKPGADVERTKQQLLELNLVPEEWGGTVPMCPISAKKGDGVEELLLTVLLVAEELALVANKDRSAKGTVIEAHMDKKVGAVATLLVQGGTLKVGDAVWTGTAYGKVRSLVGALGATVQSATPSQAVLMFGLNAVPVAGDVFEVCKNEAEAKKKAALEVDALRAQRHLEMLGGGSMVTLASLASFEDDPMETIQKLNVVIKGDTMGVVEAIKNALNQLPQDSVVLRYLWSGAGEITNADVDLCAASSGLLLAFNLTPSESVSTAAKQKGVQVRPYKVIYDLIDDVRAAMEGKLAPIEEKIDLGKAEVKAVFGTGSRKVAGCAVLEGRLRKGCSVIVRRKKQIAWQGSLSSLRRIKDTVDEVTAGMECGVGCDGYLEWQEGDLIEAFDTVKKIRKLEDAKASTAADLSQNAEPT